MIPAAAAGPFGTAPATNTPFEDFKLTALTLSASKLPKYTPMYGFSNLPVAIIESFTVVTKFAGIAKPIPTLPPLCE